MDFGIVTTLVIGVLTITLVDAAKENSRSLSDCANCGIGNKNSQGGELIINGKIVMPTNKYPWMVSLMEKNGGKFCGGAIISKEFILTAAHCVRKSMDAVEQRGNTCIMEDGSQDNCYKDSSEILIGFLTNTFRVTKGYKIKEIIPHPSFKINTGLKNDIALLRLAEPIICDYYKNTICLPPGPFKFRVGTKVAVTGWGSPNPEAQETETEELHEARITVVEPEKCYFMDFFTQAKKTAWCLHGKGKQSPCFGDSGGSMFIRLKGKFYTMGVASAHSSSVCSTMAVVVYTKVHSYKRWIKSVTGVDAYSLRNGTSIY